MKRILLVEPQFPIPTKSKNHSNFLPIGLLKLAAFYRNKGFEIRLVRGNQHKKIINFKPYRIMVTSLFTYWAGYVRDCVKYYKSIYPKTTITVGGIYASLMPKHCREFTSCDDVFIGVHKLAERERPAYDLVNNPHPLGYQIIHTSRGCFRKCIFCGVWKIEPSPLFKKSIKDEICSNKLVFYDNNLLMNPHIKDILIDISNSKYEGRPIICESQSGFDGRLLTHDIAKLLKASRFINPRIAWDGFYKDYKNIENQIDILKIVGYRPKDIYVFMLYNWKIPFKKMEKKRLKCWKWDVQIADCRYRPLDQTYDNYYAQKKQTNSDYYIHPEWNDKEVKQFRKNIRKQNICIRHGFEFYSRELENKRIERRLAQKIKTFPESKARKIVQNPWYPGEVHIVD